MKLTTSGPIVARALPWPHRPEVTTIVVRVVYGVLFDGATTVLPADVALQAGPREPALQGAEGALFKEACEIAIIGDEAAHVAEPRSVEVFEIGPEGAPSGPRKRIFVMAGASMGPLAASAVTPGGDELRSVADSQRIPQPAVPLLVAYTRGTARFEARLSPEVPHAVRAGMGGKSSPIRMTLDGIWLDPAARRIVCTFRGASFASDGDADELDVHWGAPREPLATIVHVQDDGDDLGTSTVTLPTPGSRTAAAKGLPFESRRPAQTAAPRMTVTNEGQPVAPALPFAGSNPQQPRPTPVPPAVPGATPLPFSPASGIPAAPPSEPRFASALPGSQPPLMPPPAHLQQGFPVSGRPLGAAPSVTAAPLSAPVSSPPVIAPAPPAPVLVTAPVQASVAAPRSKDERAALHRDAQRRIWAEPERANDILASLGLDPVRYRVLKRQLSRPPRSS